MFYLTKFPSFRDCFPLGWAQIEQPSGSSGGARIYNLQQFCMLQAQEAHPTFKFSHVYPALGLVDLTSRHDATI